MRIEVTTGNSDPLIYPIKESKIIIGSAENAQIHIPSSAGISRKHIQVTIEGDNYFVTDLGSTNGSFINDERLVPGKRHEFTSFFPVRLGDAVFLSLLSDEEASSSLGASIPLPTPKPAPTKTSNTGTAIQGRTSGTSKGTYTSSRSGQTKIKIAQREDNLLKKAPSPNKKSKQASDSYRMKITIIVIALMVSGAVIYGRLQEEDIVSQKAIESAPVQQVIAPVVQAITPPDLISEAQTPSLDELNTSLGEMKCVTTLEKKLCGLIPESDRPISGVVESIGRIIILWPENKLYEEIVQRGVRNHRGKNKSQLSQLIFIYFIKSLPSFPWSETDKDLFFSFYRLQDERPVLATIVGIRPNEIENLRAALPSDLEKELQEFRNKTLPNYTKYFKIINETVPR